MRAEREMGSAEVSLVMTCTGSSMVAPVNGVIDFTHVVHSRASPRQKGGDPLASDGCLSIITLKQAEQEEMEGSPRMGTTQLPAFPLGPQHQVMPEKGLAVEVTPSAGRASNPEHLTCLFGLSSSLQNLSRSQVVQLLAFSLAMGTQQRNFKEFFSSFFFIHQVCFARANLYLGSSVYEGLLKAAQPPEKLICALHLLSLITGGKEWRYSYACLCTSHFDYSKAN